MYSLLRGYHIVKPSLIPTLTLLRGYHIVNLSLIPTLPLLPGYHIVKPSLIPVLPLIRGYHNVNSSLIPTRRASQDTMAKKSLACEILRLRRVAFATYFITAAVRSLRSFLIHTKKFPMNLKRHSPSQGCAFLVLSLFLIFFPVVVELDQSDAAPGTGLLI